MLTKSNKLIVVYRVFFVINIIFFTHVAFAEHTSLKENCALHLNDELNNLFNNFNDNNTAPMNDKEFATKIVNILADDTNFKKETLVNNECGVEAQTFLLLLYNGLEKNEQAQNAHQKLIDFASQNNYSAIRFLCLDDTKFTSQNDSINYCEKFLEKNKDPLVTSTLRYYYSTLQDNYFDTEQADNLINLCEKIINKKDKDSCYIKAAQLADKLYNEKRYNEAYSLYTKTVDHNDQNGWMQYQLGYMLSNGEGVDEDLNLAIIWYESALKEFKNNHHPNSSVALLDNNIGYVYEKLMDYESAFKYYYAAAIKGYSLSKFNLSRLYFYGHGTIKDYIQAYAWISVAVAQGLNDEDTQSGAEKIQDWLEDTLANEHTLKQGKLLADKYFKQYARH
jgi:TPR repeat protein